MSVTIPPPTPVPAQGYWPMPPPGTLPGCGPPSNSLMDCYWSVQSATAFISAIMIDAINNNPAVTQAIISAIEASGSTLPLVGVTNGSNAQPGQVGEYVELDHSFPYVSGNNQTATVTAGILQPGDWDVWSWANPSNFVNWLNFYLNPIPAGFSSSMWTAIGVSPTLTEGVAFISTAVRASLAVPTLMAFTVNYSCTTAGNVQFVTSARRRR